MIDSTFAHAWQAEVLAARPLILPGRQFVYPAQVEEVERGALEVMIRPPNQRGAVPRHLRPGFCRGRRAHRCMGLS